MATGNTAFITPVFIYILQGTRHVGVAATMVDDAGVDRLFLNLRTLGSVQQNEQVWTRDNLIDKPHVSQYIVGVKRWWHSQSRKKNVDVIEAVLRHAFSVLEECTKKEIDWRDSNLDTESDASRKRTRTRNRETATTLITLLLECIVGVENLIATYENKRDGTGQCLRLRGLVERIGHRIHEERDVWAQ